MIDSPKYLVRISFSVIYGSACIPSQAMTRNSSSPEISCVITSGFAVTICCSGDRSILFLNSKSPMALDRARLPLTRPKSTKPPAALILAFSPKICQCNALQSRITSTYPHFEACGRRREALPCPSRPVQFWSLRHCPGHSLIPNLDVLFALLTTHIFCLDIKATDAVHPETSSSYLGSAPCQY